MTADQNRGPTPGVVPIPACRAQIDDSARHRARDLTDVRATVRQAIADAQARLACEPIAVYVLGSLAHGGFAPAASDIDICFVVADAQSAGHVLEALMAQARGDSDPLRQRLSLFWTGLSALRNGIPDGRLSAIDHADLIQNGVLEQGTEVRAGLSAPGRAELVACTVDFIIHKWADDEAWARSLRHPEPLIVGGPRPVTKMSLFPARFLWTITTGKFGQVADAVQWYLAQQNSSPQGRRLVSAALDWRESGRLDSDAAAILSAGLMPVWRELLDALPKDPGLATMAARLRSPAT